MTIYSWLYIFLHLQLVHHTDNTSPTLWIKPHIITALIITPQRLYNFNSHYFNNYPFLAYIYIT